MEVFGRGRAPVTPPPPPVRSRADAPVLDGRPFALITPALRTVLNRVRELTTIQPFFTDPPRHAVGPADAKALRLAALAEQRFDGLAQVIPPAPLPPPFREPTIADLEVVRRC